MAKKQAHAKHYVGMGTKSLGRDDVVYRKGASTRKSGNGATTGGKRVRRKRVAGK